MKMVITDANRSEIVLGRPFLLEIQAKEAIVAFYSTLSPQKCKKLNTEKQDAKDHLGSNVTPQREIEIFEKRLSPTAENHYANLEVTVVTK
jgi:hypothetical protein